MKRIISIICAFIMILSLFQIVYAGADNGQVRKVDEEEQKIEIEKDSKEHNGIRKNKEIEDDKELKEEVNALSEQIKENNQELVNLREEISLVTLDIQSKVKQLFSNKTTITQSEVANLKTVLTIIKKSRKGIRVIKSDGLKQQILDGKSLRENRELKKAKGHMEKVIELQQNRKLILNEAISSLDTGNQLLSQSNNAN